MSAKFAQCEGPPLGQPADFCLLLFRWVGIPGKGTYEGRRFLGREGEVWFASDGNHACSKHPGKGKRRLLTAKQNPVNGARSAQKQPFEDANGVFREKVAVVDAYDSFLRHGAKGVD